MGADADLAVTGQGILTGTEIVVYLEIADNIELVAETGSKNHVARLALGKFLEPLAMVLPDLSDAMPGHYSVDEHCRLRAHIESLRSFVVRRN